jgi:hypothetical protein
VTRFFLLAVVTVIAGAATAPAAWAEWMNLAKLTAAKDTSTSKPKDVAAENLSTEKVARISWLDKQTNRRQVLVMAVNAPQSFGGLQVEVKKCLPDYGGTLGQDVAWLEVNEVAGSGSRSAPWFAGWMLNTYPEVSTLDHPRYDMQLLGCGAKPRQIAPRAAPVIVEEAGPGADTESPGDTPIRMEEKNDGNDPFVVPGIEEKGAPAVPVQPEAKPEAAAPAEDGQVISDGEAPVVEAKPAAAQPEAAPAQAAPAAEVKPQAGEAKPADDLHKLMDGGVY